MFSQIQISTSTQFQKNNLYFLTISNFLYFLEQNFRKSINIFPQLQNSKIISSNKISEK